MPEPLERRHRRLLLCYPRAYRRERGAEMVATLLEGGTKPGPRVAANLIRHGLRCRLGRPASRTVVAWSLLAATICGLFTAAVATWAAWHTGRAQPDRAEAAAILASVLPDHDVGDIYVPNGLFLFYGEQIGLSHVDQLLFGDGGEYQLSSTSAAPSGIPPVSPEHTLSVAQQRLSQTRVAPVPTDGSEDGRLHRSPV